MRRPPRRHVPAHRAVQVWQPYRWPPLIRVLRLPPALLHRPSRMPTCARPCAEASALSVALRQLLLAQRGCYHRPSSAAIRGNLEPRRSGRHSEALRNGPLSFRCVLSCLIWKQRPLSSRCALLRRARPSSSMTLTPMLTPMLMRGLHCLIWQRGRRPHGLLWQARMHRRRCRLPCSCPTRRFHCCCQSPLAPL